MTPVGVTDISRWLSVATPPGTGFAEEIADPKGVAESLRLPTCSATLAGSAIGLDRVSGGIATLNHRLMSSTPIGVGPNAIIAAPQAPIYCPAAGITGISTVRMIVMPLGNAGYGTIV